MSETQAQRAIRIVKQFLNNKTDCPAKIAVEAIECDISDRRDLKNDWALIDEFVREKDIKPAWIEIIKESYGQKIKQNEIMTEALKKIKDGYGGECELMATAGNALNDVAELISNR